MSSFSYDYTEPQPPHYVSVPELLTCGFLWICGRAGYLQAQAFGYAAHLAAHEAQMAYEASEQARMLREALAAQWPGLTRVRDRIERGGYADDRSPFNEREWSGLRWLEWMRDHGHFNEPQHEPQHETTAETAGDGDATTDEVHTRDRQEDH